MKNICFNTEVSAMKYYILGAALLLFTFHLNDAKELPSFIKKCKRDDRPEVLEKCVIDRAKLVLPMLIGTKGIPELNLPPIEPLTIPKMNLNAQGFHIDFKNIEIFGLKDLEFTKVNFNFKDKYVDFAFNIPFMTLNANYAIGGKILLFELNSSGPSSLNLTNVNGDIIKEFEIRNKNGKEYAQLREASKTQISYKNAGLNLKNVFPGNEQLTNEVNKVLNDNFDDFTKDANPVLFKTIASIIDGAYIGPVLQEYSLSELFD